MGLCRDFYRDSGLEFRSRAAVEVGVQESGFRLQE